MRTTFAKPAFLFPIPCSLFPVQCEQAHIGPQIPPISVCNPKKPINMTVFLFRDLARKSNELISQKQQADTKCRRRRRGPTKPQR